MATYQGEKYLKIQIESLLAQDYPNLEFIWVDDASTDQSLSILKAYASQDARIHIIENLKNEGHNAAFERGMKVANGEYIALSDQDDYWIPSKISTLVNGIGDCSLVYSDSQLIDPLGKELPLKMSSLKRQIAYNSPLMYTFGAWAPGHTMLFKKEVLEVEFGGLSLDQLLEMSVDNAIDFFEKENQTKMVQKLKPLQEVGLGYVALGQPSTTLSGGEAQRIKLASFIGRGTTHDKIVFIFDEPTTGLHFHDINKLLRSFNALIDQGHTVIVVEHNLDLIKCADHLIDLGPEGGKNGGSVVAMGTPEEVSKVKDSFTGQYLKEKLGN